MTEDQTPPPEDPYGISGYAVEREIDQGVARMAARVREHRSGDPIESAGEIELEPNLPPSWRAAGRGS